MLANVHLALGRLIPLRPWIALALLLPGIAVSVAAFWLHHLWGALFGLALMGGALVFLLVPMPHPR